MKRTSPYYSLTCIVECKPSGQAFYEVIAAFNVADIATDYAKSCFTSNVNRAKYVYNYRVRERRESSNEFAKTLYCSEFAKTLYCSEPERSK